MQDNSKCTIDLTIQQLTTIVTEYSRQLLANYCDPINPITVSSKSINDATRAEKYKENFDISSEGLSSGLQSGVTIDILYTLDSASNYSAIPKLKP